MTGRMLRSWWTYLGLTLASALIGHLIFDALDDGLAAVVARPIHIVYALIVLAAFAAAIVDVYGHPGAERRRRIALMQSGLREGPAPIVGSVLVQIALAVTTLRLEGARFDQPHLMLAAICALFALLVGALVLRRIESGILRIALAAFAPRRPRPARRSVFDVLLATVPIAQLVYGLFRPNRPPPLPFA
jgi:hypothetical protein